MATDGPTPPACDNEVFENGTCIFIGDSVPSNAMEGWVKQVATDSRQRVDWHFVAGRAVVKALGDIDQARASLTKLLPVYNDLRNEALEKFNPRS